MAEPHDDAPLVGVVATPTRISAQLIERTPFGRLRSAGRRLSEDVDGPPSFVPLPLTRQLAGHGQAPQEERAGEAWVQSIANAVAKLTFGLRGGRIRVGLALDAHLDGKGRTVIASRGGPRHTDVVAGLEDALRGRNIVLAGPILRAHSLAEAWALGEVHAALGGLVGAPDGLCLVWDGEVSWAEVAGGKIVRHGSEPAGTRLDVGLASMERTAPPRDGVPQRLTVAARAGHPDVTRTFMESATVLGRASARRLLLRLEALPAAPGIAEGDGVPARVVVGGTLGMLMTDPRLAACLKVPFEAGLADGLRVREEASLAAQWLSRTPGTASVGTHLTPGLVHVAQDPSAAALGAAYFASEMATAGPPAEPERLTGPGARGEEPGDPQ